MALSREHHTFVQDVNGSFIISDDHDPESGHIECNYWVLGPCFYKIR